MVVDGQYPMARTTGALTPDLPHRVTNVRVGRGTMPIIVPDGVEVTL